MTVITTNLETFDSNQTSIQKFYTGQNILISGGTGFLGKLLIEKLLRSCSELSTIYIIIRPKKGQDANHRLEAIFNDMLFDRLKKEVPKFRHKVVALAGDCSLPGLGLSAADKELIAREISIVFNVAATVRFDERIKQAVAINVSGTKEMMDICRQIHNLKVVIHVSTAYSNCIRRDIDEQFYDPPLTADNAIKLVQSLDDKKLDAITPTLLGDFPNTYAFTKCIAEQVVQQYGKDLPTGIFRPAIVVSSYREPLVGWIDNVYGPTGAIVGGGAGLLRVMNADVNLTVELVPADYTVNALIATAWDVANNKNESADPPIYNYHANWTESFKWGDYMNLAFKHGKKLPTVRSVWCYSMTTTKNYYLYYLLTVLFHIIPAFFMDVGLFIVGKETRMLKIYKKIHKFCTVTSYFGMHKWTFKNDNMSGLWDKLSEKDQDTFYFSMRKFDWDDWMAKCVQGLRLYIFKDDMDTLPVARKRMARLVMLHRALKYAFVGLVFWGLYSLISTVLFISSNTGYAAVDESFTIRR